MSHYPPGCTQADVDDAFGGHPGERDDETAKCTGCGDPERVEALCRCGECEHCCLLDCEAGQCPEVTVCRCGVVVRLHQVRGSECIFCEAQPVRRRAT